MHTILNCHQVGFVDANPFEGNIGLEIKREFQIGNEAFDGISQTIKVENLDDEFDQPLVEYAEPELDNYNSEEGTTAAAQTTIETVYPHFSHMNQSDEPTHTSISKFHCENCFKIFRSKSRLKRHSVGCIPIRILRRPHPHQPKENVTCEICDYKFKHFKNLQYHMLECHSTRKNFKCRLCARKFRNRYYLSKHMQIHRAALINPKIDVAQYLHKQEQRISRRPPHIHRPKSNFICDICGSKIKRIRNLEYHMFEIHSSKKNFKCSRCLRKYSTRYHLAKHMKKHEVLPTLDGTIKLQKSSISNENQTCPLCHKIVKSLDDLKLHMKDKHASDSTVECGICQRKFINQHFLTLHLEQHEPSAQSDPNIDLYENSERRRKYTRKHCHTPETNFTCEICNRKIRTYRHLENHMMERHSSKKHFQCRFCINRFSTRYARSKHMKLHTDVKRATTHLKQFVVGSVTERNKSESFDDQSNMEIVDLKPDIQMEPEPAMNMNIDMELQPQTDLKPIAESSSQLDLDIGPYEILDTKADIQSNDSPNLQATQPSSATEATAIKCNVCQKQLLSAYTLREHIKNVHQGFAEHKCKCCHRKFTSESKLQYHARKCRIVQTKRKIYPIHPHRPKSDFTCDICQRTVRSFYTLNEHMQKHVTKFQCYICKEFRQGEVSLKKHIQKIHMKCEESPRTYVCSYCGKMFKDRHRLCDHEQIHKNRSHECNICGKTFTHRSGLSVHRRGVHENSRPHKCGIDGCEWTFKYLAVLRRHKARKHGLVNRRYECPLCGKGFPDSKYHLDRHLRAHANNTAKEYVKEPTAEKK